MKTTALPQGVQVYPKASTTHFTASPYSNLSCLTNLISFYDLEDDADFSSQSSTASCHLLFLLDKLVFRDRTGSPSPFLKHSEDRHSSSPLPVTGEETWSPPGPKCKETKSEACDRFMLGEQVREKGACGWGESVIVQTSTKLGGAVDSLDCSTRRRHCSPS